jgi:hypothetical protein
MEDSKIEVRLVPTNVTEPAPAYDKEKATTHGKKKVRHSQPVIALFGTFGVILWITLFSLGMLIDSSVYRKTLTTDFSFSHFIMTVLTFTPTNIAILCLISSFTGGCASLLVISKAEKVFEADMQTNLKKTTSHVYMSENPFSSMLRGIVVFFAFLAGVFVTSSNAFSNPTEQAYTQAAGFVSLLSFIVGYDPSVFRTLISISEKVNRANEKAD